MATPALLKPFELGVQKVARWRVVLGPFSAAAGASCTTAVGTKLVTLAPWGLWYVRDNHVLSKVATERLLAEVGAPCITVDGCVAERRMRP